MKLTGQAIFSSVGAGALLLICAGCVAVWGKSYNVAMSNSRSVVIEYDPVVVDMPGMLQAAQSRCDEYHKDAVLANTVPERAGILMNTYRCETRTADRVIDIQR